MIETDGKPTIASRRSDPLLRKALEKGGHLGDDVARALLASQDEVEHEYLVEFEAVMVDGELFFIPRTPDAEKLVEELSEEAGE